MTSHSSPETLVRSSFEEGSDIGTFGSSVYGGRPTFGVSRTNHSDGAQLTLYELLPLEQAAKRRERLERANKKSQMLIQKFDEVFGRSSAPETAHWGWDDWGTIKIASLSGARLRSVLPLIQETLSRAELDEGVTKSSGQSEVFLPESSGVRLALLFLGVKPIQRVDRMRAYCRGLDRMSDEECYYWYAKCRSPLSPNGEKAIRTLLTDHIG